MKKFLMGAAAVLLALGGLLTGCTNGDDDDDGTSDVGRPDIVMGLSVLLNGENLSTENTVNLSNGSSLSSTGITVTAAVTKDKNVAPESKDVSSAAKFTIDGVSYTWDESLKVGTGNKELTADKDYTVTVGYKEKSAQFTLRLTNWSVEGANTIKLIAGTLLAENWNADITVMDGETDVTDSATIALYGDDTEIKVGKTITGEKFEIRVTYNGVTVTIGVSVSVNSLPTQQASWTGNVTGGGWWAEFAGNDEKVDSGTAKQTTMTITSVGSANHNTPVIILRNSAAATQSKPNATADDGSVEYAVLRSDGYGWKGTDNTNEALEKLGWTIDTDCIFNADWLTWVNGSTLVVTVKNYGTGKADVLLDFSKGDKAQHVYYKNITVTADDLYFNLTFDGCNVTFGEPVAKTLVSISVDAGETPPIFTVGSIFTTGTLTVTAHYKDGSDERVNVSDCTFKIGDNLLEPGKTKLTDDVLGEANANDTYTVTVSYDMGGGVAPVTTTYNIKVINAELTGISVDAGKANTVFATGSLFRTTGLIVTATYDNGNTGTVALTECTFKIGNNDLKPDESKLDTAILDAANNKGEYTVTVTYSGKEAQYTITVAENVLYVGLGGENLLKVSKVEVDGVAKIVTHADLQPSGWNKIDEFETVALAAGQSVSFTFQQPTNGTDSWRTWALAIYKVDPYTAGLGQFVRGDGCLNSSTEADFTGGIWSAGTGWPSTKASYETGYDNISTGQTLPTNKDIVITVSFDGANIEITQTIDGKKSMTTNSENWVPPAVDPTDNTITGSGSVSEPFILTNETLSETVGGQAGAFDCNKNQSTTTWDAKAKLCWDNPLYGKTGLDGVTISFMLNNKVGVSYDSVLTFFPAGSTGWGGVAFTENGTAHAQGHGYWDIWMTSSGADDDSGNKISAGTWTRVTYVITKTSVTAYIGSEKFKEIPLADVDTINYLTTVCDKVAVGVGFCPELWLAGYVDEGTYLADIQVYAAALTAEQVAAISGISN